MKRITFTILCMVVAASLFSQTVVLQDVKGKVEVKPLGKDWIAAKNGMKLNILDTISTGFDASAILMVAENKVAVAPLTRLTIDKIVAQSASLKTSLHLRVGSVSAEVKSSSGVAQDFKVTSPYSTASVRGTKFVYDGFYLDVQEGRVAFIPGKPVREIVVPVPAKTAAAGSGDGSAGEGSGDGTGTDAGTGGATTGDDGQAADSGSAADGESSTGDTGTLPSGDTSPADGESPSSGPADDTLSTVPMADFLAALNSEFGGESFAYTDSEGGTVDVAAIVAAQAESSAGGGSPGPGTSVASGGTGSPTSPGSSGSGGTGTSGGTSASGGSSSSGTSGTATPPSGPAVPPPQQAVFVQAGSAAVIEIDYSAPVQPSGGNKPTQTVSGSGSGGTGSTTTTQPTGGEGGTTTGGGTVTPPPVTPPPPAPTTGTIRIIWK